MAVFTDIERQLGELWEIEQICLDASGNPLRIVDLRFRMVSRGMGAAVVMDLDLEDDAVTLVTDGSDGLALIKITAAMQAAALMTPDLYAYETEAVLADGTTSMQNFGGFNAVQSLYTKFP